MYEIGLVCRTAAFRRGEDVEAATVGHVMDRLASLVKACFIMVENCTKGGSGDIVVARRVSPAQIDLGSLELVEDSE